MPSRDDAWALLCEWTQSEALRKHALGVETVMRAMARRLGGEEEAWGLCGLLHDFDYERHPQIPDHPTKGAAILRAAGYPEEMITAILGHATFTGVPRESPMAKALFAVDELTGFLFACAFVQPDRRVASVRPESAKKKLKDKSFARGVNREDIRQGAVEIGMEVDALILLARDALAENAEALGL
ncbi:MAG: HDIG domain-containing metalloprotein [Acidobacteriota bacterium]